MSAPVGKIEEFDPEREEWPVYVERLELYLDANSITDESKKRSVLLSVIGPSAYKLVRSLVAPAKPKEKAFKELMTRHYNHRYYSLRNRIGNSSHSIQFTRALRVMMCFIWIIDL